MHMLTLQSTGGIAHPFAPVYPSARKLLSGHVYVRVCRARAGDTARCRRCAYPVRFVVNREAVLAVIPCAASKASPSKPERHNACRRLVMRSQLRAVQAHELRPATTVVDEAIEGSNAQGTRVLVRQVHAPPTVAAAAGRGTARHTRREGHHGGTSARAPRRVSVPCGAAGNDRPPDRNTRPVLPRARHRDAERPVQPP